MKKYIAPELTVLDYAKEDILSLSSLALFNGGDGKDTSEDFGGFHSFF